MDFLSSLDFSVFGEGFIKDFLPNFAATVIGVVLGLPVAIHVNKRFNRFQRILDRKESVKKLNDVVQVLSQSLRYNKIILGSISKLCMSAQVMRYPDLQLTTWEAVGNIFSSLCPDPEVIQLLSHHWLRLNRLNLMNKEMFDRTVGDLPEVSDQNMHMRMWGELFQISSDLEAHVEQLIARLDDIHTKRYA